jgi:putative sensory transduction regulator
VAVTEAVIRRWLDGLPDEATVERVSPTFWYVRLPGSKRSWIPIEIDAGERSVKLTSHVIIEPDEAHADVFRFLLRRNHRANGVSFSIDGKEAVICLVTRIDNDELTGTRLDEAVGTIFQETEEVFRTILAVGFANRFKKR